MQRKQEVMWPRLVANKILRKRLGSNNFVADFPSTPEDKPETPKLHQEPLSSMKSFDDQKDTHKYKVFVSTWNVGGIAPPDDLNMEDLLGAHSNFCDIYVFGFQEVVPLVAGNILGSDNSSISMKWNSLIRGALNKMVRGPGRNQEAKLGEQKFYPIKDAKSIKVNFSKGFRCIISKQMVGLLISIWVRSDLSRFVRHPSVSCVGCGIMGCLGNKGSVSVRFCLHETSFCFVCSHLASGGKEGDERHRNSNAAEILSRTSFPRGLTLDLPRKILDHDRVVLLGDLNYRISLPEAMTRSLAKKKEWNILLENDQLKTELMDGKVLEGWGEGVIEFPPTYKYYPRSDVYYGYSQVKKGEKRRAPAWCDRILWFGKGLKQDQYNAGNSRLSDHRPVRAIFMAEVDILRNSKVFDSFFMSDRLDQVPTDLELCTAGEFPCNGRSSFQF